MANSIKSDVLKSCNMKVKLGTKEKLNFDERNIVARSGARKTKKVTNPGQSR